MTNKQSVKETNADFVNLVVNDCPRFIKNRFRAFASAQGLTSAKALEVLVDLAEQSKDKY